MFHILDGPFKFAQINTKVAVDKIAQPLRFLAASGKGEGSVGFLAEKVMVSLSQRLAQAEEGRFRGQRRDFEHLGERRGEQEIDEAGTVWRNDHLCVVKKGNLPGEGQILQVIGREAVSFQ